MRAKEAREIPISYILASFWIFPNFEKKLGAELRYKSPIRENDKNPSFKVDTHKNLRFDFWISKWGNALDLFCEIRQVNIKEALQSLDNFSVKKVIKTKFQNEAEKIVAGEKEKNYLQILSVSELSNTVLLNYLKERKINEIVARKFLNQVIYKPQNSCKIFYALGFPAGEGYELRSKIFKGITWKSKQITKINLKNWNTLSIFEGFMDFLSFLSHYELFDFQGSVIVLNSSNLKSKAIEEIKQYHFSKIYLFLDNDKSGDETKKFFMEKIKNIPIIDKSVLYSNYKDFNQMTTEK